MKLNLRKIDAIVKSRKIKTSEIWIDQGSFDPQNLRSNDVGPRPAGNARGGAQLNNGLDQADVIGKY